MKDLFAREQGILDLALDYMDGLQGRPPGDSQMLETLANEYGVLLKQLRTLVRISDKASMGLRSAQKERVAELAGQVHYDALTGIYNRRYMEEALNKIVNAMKRAGGGMLSVLILDLDYFKKYNDTYGHAEGDACLQAVAKAISVSITRTEDFVARYGGEEFVVVLPNAREDGACIIAERAIENVRNCNIPHSKNKAAPVVTLSIGIATGNVRTLETGLEYIKRADQALYASKANGRNRYTLYRQSIGRPEGAGSLRA